jgi:regulation of enolase protein 1 (concanavalin A-like superfamily)
MAFLEESFATRAFAPQLGWLNEPPSYELGEGGLTVETRAGSDFWQRTHYGFRRDDGHALLHEVAGDFRLETEVSFRPLHRYDQAGLLVRLSADCWLKASIEFELEAPSRLGSVVTNHGWSDWATQNVPASVRAARYRITRSSGDYRIEHAPPGGDFAELRIARLHADDGSAKVYAGIYACSPEGAGFSASFRFLKITEPG